MKPFLRQQLDRYPVRLQELDFFLQQPEVVQDMQRFRALTREHAEVSEVARRFAAFLQREADLAAARGMLDDPEMADMAREEITSAESDLAALEDELQRLLLPKDPDDVRNALVAAGFTVVTLETEDVWMKSNPAVLNLIRQLKFSDELRGDDIFALARKTSAPVERYPSYLYVGVTPEPKGLKS